jgi:dipeptidyl aminopeptidase/acylaminoacyl peptidase
VLLSRSLQELLELSATWPLAFSPDGASLLLASDRPGVRQLFRIAVEGGEVEQLTDLPEPVDGTFLPDGRILVLVDEGGNERTQLYLLGDGGQLEPLVVDPRFNHWTPIASRDGSRLAYTTNRENGVEFEVVVRTLARGVERTFDLRGNLDAHGFSPDGRWIVAERLGVEIGGDSDLFLLEVETGDVHHITPHEGAADYATPAWLPDSSGFYAATNAFGDVRSLARYDIASAEWTEVLDSSWDLQCAIDTTGRTLLVHANEDGWSQLELRDPATLELRRDIELPGQGVVMSWPTGPVFSPDGSKLAFGYSSPRQPFEAYVYDLDADELTRLTGEGPIEGIDPELRRFRSFDGEEIPVFLFKPDGEGPFPVVVTVHGGPEAQWQPFFSPRGGAFTQFLLDRGYAVAAPNVRGSSGYGKRFMSLDDVGLRLDSVRDLAELHAWLSARPEIDGARAVVYGGSYGGYMTLASLAFYPELWAAGISFVGISNLVTFLENTSEYRRAVREREYGSLANDREILWNVSAASRLDDIRAPLFLEHGRNDPRVPVGESEYIHRMLTEKGIRCELVIYEDEGHMLEKLANRIDAFERAVAFLDEVLS